MGALRLGSAEYEMRMLLRRFAGGVRSTAPVICLLLGLIVLPGRPWPAVAGMLLLAAWSVGYAVVLVRWSPTSLVILDLAVLGGAALTQRWTVPERAAADSTSWVLAILTVAVVTLQWFTEPTTGMIGSLTLLGAYLGGAWWAVGSAEVHRLTMVLWLIPQAILSRACVIAVVAAARRLDLIGAAREQERVAANVNAARRRDEHEYQALVHDTVAATLLMVGVGAVQGTPGWLRDQAAEDLRVLSGNLPKPPTDLTALLHQEIARSPVRVAYESLPSVRLSDEVAVAIAGGVREALTNVHRHSGVDRATMSAETDPLRIRVSDAGRGFRPESDRSAHRRGISTSILARTAAAGGHAEVASAPGRGTVVTLEWAGV
jgi:histidine kinase/DNA gyrase B/HSP90-like ATPase